MMHISPELLRKTANTIRFLSIDAVQKANSGHPGMPMGMADVATVLWTKFLKHNPQNPAWFNRDRFVLSAGHGSMLLYSLLHLTGYDVSMDDIKNFRQWGSKTAGHPEFGHTPGVEVTTGPLGQGLSTAIGMALAERHLASRFNTPEYDVIDHFTYVIASDGDLMEGITHEACSLAGHWALGKLVVLYDDNGITIDGTTELSFSENVLKRYEAYGWHIQTIDGHDYSAIEQAIVKAQNNTNQPSIIACKTHIGYGSPNKQDTSASHGSPLGQAEITLTKQNLDWTLEPTFYVPNDVWDFTQQALQNGQTSEQNWQQDFATYAKANAELAQKLSEAIDQKLPENWAEHLPLFSEKIATRNASGKVLDVLKKNIPFLIGGSADLTGSNKTMAKLDPPISKENYGGSYLFFGVREHGMGAIVNGMVLHGGIRAYSGTFLIFSDYMRPAMRLASLMDIPAIYVFSHDSIGLGEDGPTHQPVEHLASLRAIPNLYNFRPADGNETVACWKAMLQQKHPTTISLTRQDLPALPMEKATQANRGGYILSDATNPQAVLLATGSEVEIALEAQSLLAQQGINVRVVSMPCWELFDEQPLAYQEEVLLPELFHVAIEAGIKQGWEKYIGTKGIFIGMNGFGASAPFETLYEKFGITSHAVVEAVKENITA